MEPFLTKLFAACLVVMAGIGVMLLADIREQLKRINNREDEKTVKEMMARGIRP